MERTDYLKRLKFARLRGEGIAKDYGFAEFPVDPFSVAAQVGIEVQAKPESAVGVSGMLLRHGDNFGIIYATHLNNSGFERFSVAHELGHYFLPGHMEQILPNNAKIHESRGNFRSNDIFELEADHFAAGLLLPSSLIKKHLGRFKDGLKAIIEISTLAQTSLLATAIAYIQTTPCPAAIIISSGKTMEYGFLSQPLLGVKDLDRPYRGALLSSDSLTIDFNADEAKITSAQKTMGTIDISDWLGGRSIDGKEEVIGLGAYGKTLTILTCPNYPTDGEVTEDDELEASWTPRLS